MSQRWKNVQNIIKYPTMTCKNYLPMLTKFATSYIWISENFVRNKTGKIRQN